jgi:type IV secretory pathway VirB4 component
VIVESTATKIFLPNVHARDPKRQSALYRRMGLNSRQIEIHRIGHVAKRQYYSCFREMVRRLYELALGQSSPGLCRLHRTRSPSPPLNTWSLNMAMVGYKEWLEINGLKLNNDEATVMKCNTSTTFTRITGPHARLE